MPVGALELVVAERLVERAEHDRMDRGGVERARLGEERVDPARLVALERVAAVRGRFENAREIGARLGNPFRAHHTLDERPAVVARSAAATSSAIAVVVVIPAPPRASSKSGVYTRVYTLRGDGPQDPCPARRPHPAGGDPDRRGDRVRGAGLRRHLDGRRRRRGGDHAPDRVPALRVQGGALRSGAATRPRPPGRGDRRTRARAGREHGRARAPHRRAGEPRRSVPAAATRRA